MLNDRMITRCEECAPFGRKTFDYTKSLSASSGEMFMILVDD